MRYFNLFILLFFFSCSLGKGKYEKPQDAVSGDSTGDTTVEFIEDDASQETTGDDTKIEEELTLPDGMICQPNTVKCAGNDVVRCTGNGDNWQFVKKCESPAKCANGECCTPQCADKECGSDGCDGSCGSCSNDYTCDFTGKCVPKASCGSTPLKVTGKFKTKVSEIDFDKAAATVYHKRDVDQYEDGCIYEVGLSLTRGDGCTLYVNAGGTLIGNSLLITDFSFTADSQCPGFPDNIEGTYANYGGLKNPTITLSVVEVPDYNSPTSCFSSSMTINLEGFVKAYGIAQELEILKSAIIVSGDFTSSGSTSAKCPCKPNCINKDCGDDGCGGSCGECTGSQFVCENNKCKCQPYCYGKDCGSDGCGGQCGQCQYPKTCNTQTFKCVDSCIPNCTNKECGDDGCGKQCGTCQYPEVCQNDKCVNQNIGCGPEFPACKDCVCKVDSFCCTGWDNLCTEECTTKCPNECTNTCVSNCVNKECGDDGCGKQCGTCLDGKTCDANFKCVAQTGCGNITWEGCCSGNTLKYCENNAVKTIDCTQQPSCGWKAEQSYYDCGTSGGSDPSGAHPKNCY